MNLYQTRRGKWRPRSILPRLSPITRCQRLKAGNPSHPLTHGEMQEPVVQIQRDWGDRRAHRTVHLAADRSCWHQSGIWGDLPVLNDPTLTPWALIGYPPIYRGKLVSVFEKCSWCLKKRIKTFFNIFDIEKPFMSPYIILNEAFFSLKKMKKLLTSKKQLFLHRKFKNWTKCYIKNVNLRRQALGHTGVKWH